MLGQALLVQSIEYANLKKIVRMEKWPTSWSMKPDPIPFICTLVLVSAWIYFTNEPCEEDISTDKQRIAHLDTPMDRQPLP